MSAAVGWLVFLCAFGGALLGLFLQSVLPEHHLSAESKNVIGLGVGLIGTMAALLLGLLIASAQGTYEAQRGELAQLSAKVVLLDRLLAHYGPEAAPIREQLRLSTQRVMAQMWPGKDPPGATKRLGGAGGDRVYEDLQELSPHNDQQRWIQSQALATVMDLGNLRALMSAQSGAQIPLIFLILVVFWLTVVFISFGLFAARNTTVIATLFLCALAVATAIFLILELNHPYAGLIRLRADPLQAALAQLGR